MNFSDIVPSTIPITSELPFLVDFLLISDYFFLLNL